MASKTSDGELIALLRDLRAGAGVVDSRFVVHHVDVCSAAPEDLVADLEPAPGTDLADVWYFYCEKKYKNAQGKRSGHRQRAIGGGGDTCWHAETRPKDVEGSEGGTFCNLSYGRKKLGSGRSFDRLGWCMTEYDDTQHGGGDFALCKAYRSSSSLAKGKSKSLSSSSSSSSKKTTSSKRKAASDHAEARPTKLIYEQTQPEAVCYQGLNSMFTDELDHQVPTNVEDLTAFREIFREFQDLLGPETRSGEGISYVPAAVAAPPNDEEEQHVQQPSVEPTQGGGEFFETEYGLLPSAVAQIDVAEWMACPETFEGGEEQQSGEPEQGGEFMEMVTETTVEDLLGPETRSGEGISYVPAAVAPPNAEFFVGLDPNWAFREQEDQVGQMQQPRAEPDPLDEMIKRLKEYRLRYSLWPTSPSTSCAAAMPCQQQGSHSMQPLHHLPCF